MKQSSSQPSDFPEFGVRYETISGFFDPPLARSTFHDSVKKGLIIPMKGMRGFYLLNESLRRLGLKEVRELPVEPAPRSLEDIVRLAFTLIDDDLFPAPSWLLDIEVIDTKDLDHARRIADDHREKVEAFDHVNLKMAAFQGVLDAAAMVSAEAKADGG